MGAAVLTAEQMARYSRQIILKEIGGIGQRHLLDAHIMVLGVGALGASALLYLGGAGVGRLTLVDDARVADSLLPGDIIHERIHAGQPVVYSAKQRIHAVNPEVEISALDLPLSDDYVIDKIKSVDLVLDLSADLSLKWDQVCIQQRVPLFSGWVDQHGGWAAASLVGVESEAVCMRCQGIKQRGNVTAIEPFSGLLAGMVGTVLATEACKWLMGLGTGLRGQRWCFSPFDTAFKAYPVERQGDCPVCSKGSVADKVVEDRQEDDAGAACIDITTEQCPMTFVKVKLKLESMPPGQELTIRLNGGEPLHNVPLSLVDEGCWVSSPMADDQTGTFILKTRRPTS
ncbi:MAG: ThiF family adenylyltransferase [Magnetococcales bacterium]|nr:ThiF family adenylyltransferase [Magnetococcales bacterium]